MTSIEVTKAVYHQPTVKGDAATVDWWGAATHPDGSVHQIGPVSLCSVSPSHLTDDYTTEARWALAAAEPGDLVAVKAALMLDVARAEREIDARYSTPRATAITLDLSGG